MEEAPKPNQSNNELPHNNTLFYSGPQSQSQRVLYTASQFAKTSLLYLQECGNLKAIRPHVSGRNHLSSYLFFVVKEGEGWLEFDGVHYELEKGSAVFIDCRKGYSQSSSEKLWQLSWVHFNSANMSAIYNKWNERGGKPTFHPDDVTPFIKLLDDLYTTAASSSFVRDVEINTLLSQLIGLLFDETVYEDGEQPTAANTTTPPNTTIDLTLIKSYIDTHYKELLSLDSLANQFYVNKNYLARLFKEKFGMSVGSYITLVRVGRAKELLRFSDMSVEAVGDACGYEDGNYFGRVFKKVEGVSPSRFRGNWKSGSSVKDSENGGRFHENTKK